MGLVERRGRQMIIHVSNRAEATAKLTREQFHEIENGAWVSASRETKATIHPCVGRETVQIAYQQVFGIDDNGRYAPIPFDA